ncbi:MAG: DUF922 domain-containing Zn-dependent protease [Pseudodesulfovibrio sp.]
MKRLLIFLALILFATPCLAEVIVTEQVDYFAVTGKTPKQIMASIQKSSPRSGKKTFDLAQTRSEFRYEYKGVQNGDRCTVNEVTIYLNLTYIYPRLAVTPKNKSTRRWWAKELVSYEKHEETHGNISRELANKMHREIQRMDDLNCATRDAEIKRRVDYYSRQATKKHEAFDRKDRRY